MSTYRLFLLALIALWATPALHAAKGYHLWYDEDGQAVYSQFRPGGGRESETVKPPPHPAESAEVARQRLRERLQQFEDKREDASLARETAEVSRAKAAGARQRCATARANLKTLNGRARQLYRTPDGKVVRMNEEQRQEKRAEMEEIIAADCKSS